MHGASCSSSGTVSNQCQEFGYEMMPITALVGGKKDISSELEHVPLENLSWYSCEDADFSFRLYEKFERALKKEKLFPLFSDIDMPLVPILAGMERHGVRIDTPYLKHMSKEASKKISMIEKSIFMVGSSTATRSPALKSSIFLPDSLP